QSSAELYDPISDSWSAAAPMAAARSSQSALLLGNGTVLVTGGTSNGSILSSAELYDPLSNSWSAAASMTTARFAHTAILLDNGQVLVAGGANAVWLSSAEVYHLVLLVRTVTTIRAGDSFLVTAHAIDAFGNPAGTNG